MKELTTYKKDTGQLIAAVQCNSPSNYNTPEMGYVDGLFSYKTHYYDLITEQLTARSALPISVDVTDIAADATDMATISGIPAGTTVRLKLDGSEDIVNDGSYEFKTDTAGEYVFVLSLFPYIDAEVIINAA